MTGRKTGPMVKRSSTNVAKLDFGFAPFKELLAQPDGSKTRVQSRINRACAVEKPSKRKNNSGIAGEKPAKNQKLYSEVAKMDLTVQVKKNGNVPFSDEEFSSLRGYVVGLQDSIPEENYYPVFKRTFMVRGSVHIECADSRAVEWLIKFLPDISRHWAFGDVAVLKLTDIPRRVRSVFILPQGIDDSFNEEKFRTRVRRANPNLDTAQWEFWKVDNNSYGGKVAFFGVDESSAKLMSKGDGNIFYLMGMIQVRVGSTESCQSENQK